jgi:murein endopeptidase
VTLLGACLLAGVSRPVAAEPPEHEKELSPAGAVIPTDAAPEPEIPPTPAASPEPLIDEPVQPLAEILPVSNALIAPEGGSTTDSDQAVEPEDEPLPDGDETEPSTEEGVADDEDAARATEDAATAVEASTPFVDWTEPVPVEDLPAGLPESQTDSAAEPTDDPDAAVESEIRLDDRAGLLQVLKSEPASLGPLSIGSPDGGLLFNPLPMPEGALWSIRDPRETFATAETIDFLIYALEEVEARHPGSPRLLIGDMSRPDGGRLNRHRSHQVGRDADLGFYYLTGEAPAFRKPGRNELDLVRTWTLVRTLVTGSDVQRIFLDRAHQRPLYAYALAQGEDPEWLDDIFGRKTAGKDAIIQHERRHHDHMHVRFFNAGAQEKGRVAYPLLVEAGLVPGPTLTHRVRRGETLSYLARRYGASASAIRSVNRLRGSALRAGRSYVIPVRKIPQVGDPVVVPPRRLPRELKAEETLAPPERADAGGE